MTNLSDDLTPEEASKLAEALRQFNNQLRKMIEKLLEGKQLNEKELERLARLVGLNQADNLRYREWMVQRMKRAMRFKEVQDALQELANLLAELGMDKERIDQMQRLLQANQKGLEDQLRQFAGQRIAENMSQRPPDDSLDNLMDRPFSALSDGDMQRLRKEVQRLASALRTRVALRQKHAKSGRGCKLP